MLCRSLISACFLPLFLAQPAFSQADAVNPSDTVDPVPRLMTNLQSDSVRIASSAARSLGVVFAPGRTQHPARDEVIDALIVKLDSKLGGPVRRAFSVTTRHTSTRLVEARKQPRQPVGHATQ